MTFPPYLEYTDIPITLEAKGGQSGNPVTYQIRGPATVVGNKLKILGVGKLTIAASQAGNADYLPAPTVTVSVPVEKAQFWVYAKSAVRPWGQPNPTFKYTITDYSSEKLQPGAYFGAPLLTTIATKFSAPGTYLITTKIGTLASKDYRFLLYDATLTISPLGVKRPPTLTPAPKTYKTPQMVKITDGTSGAKIYYTLDGTKPTIASERYSEPITVSKSETIKAFAVAEGYTQSGIATART